MMVPLLLWLIGWLWIVYRLYIVLDCMVLFA